MVAAGVEELKLIAATAERNHNLNLRREKLGTKSARCIRGTKILNLR